MKRNTNSPAKAAPVPALPHDVAEALAAATAPMPLPPARKHALAERLLARVRADTGRFVTVRRDDGQWEQLAPDIAMKILDRSDAMQAFLLRLDAGACLPSHPHAEDEMCFVLEGTAQLGDLEVRAGDYHLAPAGSTHGDVTTRTGCLLLLRTGSNVNPHREAIRGT
jgi:mannose-6-phosphate isomerase-like protein (cupin superfamily)